MKPIAAMRMRAAGGAAPAQAWNPADKDADVSLSGGDTVATVVSTGSEDGSVRGVTARDASGDHSFSVTVTFPDAGGSYRTMVGIGKAGATLAQYPGYDADGYGMWANSGNLYNNAPSGSGAAYGAAYATTSVITVRVNAGALTFYINGASQGVAATGLTGTWYPMWGPGSAASGTRTGTVDTSAGQPYLPSGSNAWG